MRRSLTLLSLGSLFILTSYAYGVCGPGVDTLPGGQINVGTFGSNFTVFGAAGFSDGSTSTNNTLTGPSFVQGNIGIGPNGTFHWTDGTIDGSIYMYDGPGSFKMSGPAHFAQMGEGVNYNQGAILSPAFTDYQNLSDAACGETPTPAYASITNVSLNGNQSMTITGAPGQKVVLSLQNFSLNGNSTFTLQGTATTSFIINVARNFSLTGNSQILLAGVPPKNVLFNIRGTGSDVALTGNSSMSGILLALNRRVSVSGGTVYGRVIGGQVNITSGGQVISR
jgi:hypothetical protein